MGKELTDQDAIRGDEYLLKLAIHRHGKDSSEAREAAIRLCRTGGIDPHWKTATQPKVIPELAEPVLVELSYFEEWQRIVALYAAP